MKNLGNFIPGQTIRGAFNSRTASGAPVTLAGSPVLSVYKDANTTEVTTGVTLSVDFDSRTGYHVYTIVTTDAFYSRGSDFRLVLTAGTVDSVSVVGVEVGSFSLDNRPGEAIAFKSALSIAGASTTEQTVTSGPEVAVGDVLAIYYTAAGALRAIANGTYDAAKLLVLSAAPADPIQGTDLVTVYPIAASVGDGSIGPDAFATDAISADAVSSAAAAKIFTNTDRTQLQTIFGKLPSKDYLAGTDNVDGNIEMSDAIGNFPGSVAGVTGGINTAAGTITTLDGLDSAQDLRHDATQAATTSLLARLGAFTGTGVNTVLGFFLALLKKDAATPSDIGGTFSPATDSLEAASEEMADVAKVGEELQHTLVSTSGTPGEAGSYDRTTQTRV